ncbi:unnamed protein product [Polarella glacialis]|uniref:Uncharacterized protein n=1 Tax=Polarella glacialis TaxID=89957 RepID=A0A813E2U0_POLGL|nr:unnamed protein product [Polarella glacialis]
MLFWLDFYREFESPRTWTVWNLSAWSPERVSSERLDVEASSGGTARNVRPFAPPATCRSFRRERSDELSCKMALLQEGSSWEICVRQPEKVAAGTARESEGGPLIWQTRWAEEGVRQERCIAHGAKALATANARLGRRRGQAAAATGSASGSSIISVSSRGRGSGALGSSPGALAHWHLLLASWRSWLATEKNGRQFGQLVEELRSQEDEHQMEHLKASQNLSDSTEQLVECRAQTQRRREKHKLAAYSLAAWRAGSWSHGFAASRLWGLALALRCWRQVASQARRARHARSRHVELVVRTQQFHHALWAWRACSACCRRGRDREGMDAALAALPRRGRVEAASQTQKVLVWVALHVHAGPDAQWLLCRSVLVAWQSLAVGAEQRRVVTAALLGGAAPCLGRSSNQTTLVFVRCWAAWREAAQCSRLKVAHERAWRTASELAQAHCGRANLLANVVWGRAEMWLAFSALLCWRTLPARQGLQCALEQVQREGQASSSTASRARQETQTAKSMALNAKQEREEERASLEARLASAQSFLLRLRVSGPAEAQGQLAEVRRQRQALAKVVQLRRQPSGRSRDSGDLEIGKVVVPPATPPGGLGGGISFSPPFWGGSPSPSYCPSPKGPTAGGSWPESPSVTAGSPPQSPWGPKLAQAEQRRRCLEQELCTLKQQL